MTVQDRLLAYVEDIYADAVDHFRLRHFYFCGIISTAVVSVTVFLLTDEDTPDAIRDKTEELRKAAQQLVSEARLAEMGRASLSGDPQNISTPDALSLFFEDAYLRSRRP